MVYPGARARRIVPTQLYLNLLLFALALRYQKSIGFPSLFSQPLVIRFLSTRHYNINVMMVMMMMLIKKI